MCKGKNPEGKTQREKPLQHPLNRLGSLKGRLRTNPLRWDASLLWPEAPPRASVVQPVLRGGVESVFAGLLYLHISQQYGVLIDNPPHQHVNHARTLSHSQTRYNRAFSDIVARLRQVKL